MLSEQQIAPRQRYIVCWRKTDHILDWEHHVAFSLDDAQTTVRNIKAQGVRQYYTAPLGDRIPELSSEY